MHIKYAKSSFCLLIAIFYTIHYSYAITPIITRYSTDFFKAFYQYRLLEDKNCKMKSSNILTAYVCDSLTTIVNSYQINGFSGAEFLQVIKAKITFFDVKENNLALLNAKNSLLIGKYSNFSLNLRSYSFDHDTVPLGLKIERFEDKNEQIIFIYTSISNLTIFDSISENWNVTWKIALIDIDKNLTQQEFEIGSFDSAITIKDFNLKTNKMTGNYFLSMMLSNNTFVVYETNKTKSSIKLLKIFPSDANRVIDIFMSENYLLLINATSFPTLLSTDTQIELHKIDGDIASNPFINSTYCSFSVGILSEYFEVYLHERNDYLTLFISNQPFSVLVYHIGRPNDAMFCKHIILQNIVYDSNLAKSSLGFYQDDKQSMPVLIFQDEYGSYPFFFQLCLPGYFFHPLYQTCKKCEQNYFSIGAKETHCIWCDGYYLDIINKDNLIIDKIFTLDSFYLVAESCYAQKQSSSSCLDCMHEFHVQMKSQTALQNSSMVHSPKDPRSNKICQAECGAEFLSAIKQGPTSEMLNIDKCGQMSDCYDCNAAENCMWCNNSCTSINNCSMKLDVRGKDSVAEYLTLFEQCSPLPLCGEKVTFIEDSKEITISNDTIKKNSICKWAVYFGGEIENTVSEISLSLGDFYSNISNYLGFYIYYCYYTVGMKRCILEKLPVGKETTSYPLSSYFFQVYMIVNNDIENNATQIQFSYKRIGTDYYTTALLIIAWVMIAIMVLIMVICTILICKRCGIRLRRFRLLRQLRGGAINDEEAAHLSIDLPVTQSWRNMLLNVKFSQKENEFDQKECCFCIEQFKDGETVAKLLCKHIFHPLCFENWITLHSQSQIKCPICARVII